MVTMDFKGLTVNVPIILLLLCTARSVYGSTQSEVDYMCTYMQVKVKSVDNLIDELHTFKVRLILRNSGTEVIKGGDWAIYFCSIRHIVRPKNDQPEMNDYMRYGVNITRVKGCSHRLEPLDTFGDISPNSEKEIYFLAKKWFVSRSDFAPNWYVVSKNGAITPRTIESTSGESLDFVEDFTEPRQWKRYDFTDKEGNEISDKYDPYSPRMRYSINDVRDRGSAQNLVIPTPVSIANDYRKMVYFGTHDWQIVVENQAIELMKAANFLSAKYGMPIVSIAPDIRYIRFHVGSPKVEINGIQSNSTEAYELKTNADGQWASIMASSAAGAFYGVQSLAMLWGETMESPEVTIKDAPRFEYRGMHLDVGRNFHKKDFVMKLLDAMAMYKLNKFHFHLSEDEGWRMEIPGLPQLTQVGGKRCFDVEETQCIMSQYGSGPTTHNSGTGFYRVAEYQDILRYAAERFIEVIPEFDMPGHSHAAIKAMEKRYDDLIGVDPARANEYLLTDPNDPSQYVSAQMFTDNAINPCMNSTYNFVRKLVKEMVKIHEGHNPLKLYHFGGDEVAKGAWENSTICNDFMNKNKDIRDANDIKEYMVRRITEISAAEGVDLAAWEDGLMGRDYTPFDTTKMANGNVFGYAWHNVWESGASNRAYKLANANFKVIMAQATHLYFDHPYEPDPEERGYYWATRFTDSRKTFGFMPDNIYSNAEFTRNGDPITEAELCKEVGGISQCIPLTKPENILGMQGHLWSETVRTPEQADYMIFPRLLALAERAWHKADWEDEKDVAVRKRRRNEDWEKFANTLGYRELRKLDKMGIKYRVPQPGAKVGGSVLSTNSAFPGLTVEYSTDGGKTWCSEKTTGISGKVWLRTRSADGSRTSRTEFMECPIISKATYVIPNVMIFILMVFFSFTRF